MGTGKGPYGEAGQTPQATLLYTGTAPEFISLKSASGIELRDLYIQASNSQFTGSLINADKMGTPNANDASYVLCNNCQFTAPHAAHALVRLNNTISSRITNCRFLGGQVGILGRDNGYSNAIVIDNCSFGNPAGSGQAVASIKNAGEAWLIQSCTFEPLQSLAPGAYKQDLNYQALQVSFICNWIGDSTQPGTAIQVNAAGLVIAGNHIFLNSQPGDTGIVLNGGEGVSIIGNYVQGATTSLEFAGNVFGASVQGNSFNAITTAIKHPERAINSIIVANNVGGSAAPNIFNRDLKITTGDPYLINVGYVHLNPFDGSIELGSGNDGYSFIDFKGKDNLNSDFQGRLAHADGGGFDFITGAASRLWVGASGNVGVGTTAPQSKLHVAGDVTVGGNLSKGSGTFLIDHPLDPENKNLYHGFVEAPRHDLIYRGQTPLRAGRAVVQIDEASNMTKGTFHALTQNPQIFLQNATGWEPLKATLADGALSIVCRDISSTDTVEWMVIAERADAFIKSTAHTDERGRMTPEVEKPAPTTAQLRELERCVVMVDGEKATPDTEFREVVQALVGKKGYPLHGAATGGRVPQRSVVTKTRVKPRAS